MVYNEIGNARVVIPAYNDNDKICYEVTTTHKHG